MYWREIIQSRLRKIGYRLTRSPLKHFLDLYNIDLILDVGANKGQYGTGLRNLGYRGGIVSFEPLTSAYAQLEEASQNDSNWHAVKLALGAKKGQKVLQVAGNSVSSSILEMLPAHREAAPDSEFTGKETVTVERLDEIFDDYCSDVKNVFLKIDTQGYEMKVLEGATDVFDQISGLQLELSLTPLYKGPLIEEVITYARRHGFVPMWLDHGFKHAPTQQLLQVDGLFFREEDVL